MKVKTKLIFLGVTLSTLVFIGIIQGLGQSIQGIVSLAASEEDQKSTSEHWSGAFTPELPKFPEIKGSGQITDEIAQLVVGTAVKYRLLPSVILSQYAYESSWGKSSSALHDFNNFGITWYLGCPFPQGTMRGIGGSEGGFYMRFPNQETGFSYYGFMLVSQSNFNASRGNKSPSEVLLILGRGGYAASGIDETSDYYRNCMNMIQTNRWVEQYDKFAIDHWQESDINFDDKTGIESLEKVLGEQVNNGQCYGLSAYYAKSVYGINLMGSGFMYASKIGSDYDWSAVGGSVIFNPQFDDVRAGDIINFNTGGYATSVFGHTGVVAQVDKASGQLILYEQNCEKGQIVAKYTRTWHKEYPNVASLIRKEK
ncbi:glucosaminidase domain-containing protein [Listeria innocua]|uniref:glucosaminidase domain-containing protein n=1 Tax=Listeria innocua TaxID=1642 RepID=UPI001627BF55|nr:glucosaminidase domain-containing protein [Listeria innocua]MBC1925555.1 CHAP domain-containing protein [Listeria innocua]